VRRPVCSRWPKDSSSVQGILASRYGSIASAVTGKDSGWMDAMATKFTVRIAPWRSTNGYVSNLHR
jgi:hypothetical protein